MVAALQERDHHRTDCAHAGGGGHSVLTALHGGALQLEGTGGGVSAAGVLIAGDLLGKLVSALLHSFKAESRGLIDRRGQRAVGGIVALSGVDDHGLKIDIAPVQLAHVSSLLQ